jgi:hypothetical protein
MATMASGDDDLDGYDRSGRPWKTQPQADGPLTVR